MSEYEYTYPTSSGPDLTISSFKDMAAHVWISSNHQPGGIGSYIPNADVPTLAAELLRAAGQEGVFVPMRPQKVRVNANGVLECGDGTEYANALASSDPTILRNRAANHIALAEYIESKAAREADAEKKLQERRDALATEFSMGAYSYEVITPMVKFAIDRIIELEDERDAA